MFRLFIVLSYLLMVFYGHRAFKNVFRGKWPNALYFLFTLGVFAVFFVEVLLNVSGFRYDSDKILVFAIFFSFYILVMILAGAMLLEDIYRALVITISVLKKWSLNGVSKKNIPERRKFISKTALALGALPFGGLLYGIFEGRYNFKVFRYVLEFADLPRAFDGYQISHISDIHCGGLDNYDKVVYAVDLINEQKSDLILFTGDFINRKSGELNKWKDVFSKLEAKEGKYSILGNHDYGDYFRWDSEDEKKKNFEDLKRLQKEMGFVLLCDQCHFLKKGGSRLALIGSENWSVASRRMQKGDIERAIKGVGKDDFKILLTHDPSHWEQQIIHHREHFHLTLSGHTHGFQFGIEIPGLIKWSPFIGHKYNYWAGIYEESGQYINVNRGFGYTGFPGRLGIWPEISVITLKKKHRA